MGFTTKSRWLTYEHRTTDTIVYIYAGVISIYIAMREFTYYSLNCLDTCAADIRILYMQALSLQNYYRTCGPKFGLEILGVKDLTRRYLYGGKYAGQ